MRIDIKGLSCRYGRTPALHNVDLSIEEGSFVALLGPSGAGKTTLLRLLAGLEQAESGSIRIGGEDAVPIPVNRRRIGFVFQQYALFRHMSVARNIAFGLEMKKRSERPAKAEISRRVDELLDLVQLPGYGARLPHQLSGGQRQRVALARALAIEPRILLLDEPFGALDAKVRTEMRIWLKALQKRLKITAVFVTHDQSEALELADRIVVMRKGEIEQDGTPDEVYRAPRTSFVYGFLGEANAIPVQIIRKSAHTADGRFLRNGVAMDDGPATLWFRPHETVFAAAGEPGALEGRIVDLSAYGPRSRAAVEHEGRTIHIDLPPSLTDRYRPGAPCHWRTLNSRVLRD
jgi:sulfate transport system ATP-binding protein